MDWEDFQDRHELINTDFEVGRLTLEQYLERTIFYRSRPFTKDEFRVFMFAQSQSQPDTLAIVERLSRSKKYLMATLNNEPLELNLYRIEQFRLRNYFTVFFSSSFLGVRKPDSGIYRLALQISQRALEECLFIDDRALNLECARLLGMSTIHYQNPALLCDEFQRNGVEVEPK